MHSFRRLSPVLFLVLLVLRPVSLSAYWPLDGVSLSAAASSKACRAMVTDGSDGAIIFFEDERYGNIDIFAQRIDGNGNILWDSAGVPICTVTGDQKLPAAVSDGSGGAIVAWEDSRGGFSDIYAQHIDADGIRQWIIAGLAVCTAASDQYSVRITTDDAGGAILAWHDHRNSINDDDIYARRVDSGGNVLWTILGEPICTGGTADGSSMEIASDGEGGAYIVWHDQRAGNWDIYCERITSDGSVYLGSGGYALVSDLERQVNPAVAEVSSNRIIVVWEDWRNPGSKDLYAQLVSNVYDSWTPGGVQVWSVPGSWPYRFDITFEPDVGLSISVQDLATDPDSIYVQRLDVHGSQLWSTGGILVSSGQQDPSYPYLVSDGDRGVIVMWKANSPLGDYLLLQRVDEDGNILWEEGGTRISPGTYGQEFRYFLLEEGSGGALVAWTDDRYESAAPEDCYVQHIDRNGYIGSPEPMVNEVTDVPMDQGGKVELTWNASYLDPWPYQEITYYSIWKSLSPASAMLMLESGIEPMDLESISPSDDGEPGMPCRMVIRYETVGASTYYWELLETQTAQYYEGYSKVLDTDFTSLETAFTYSYYQVAAHTIDPLVVWTSQPDSGYSLDNLAPTAPVGLAGEQEYSPEGMDLVWNSNTEEDLSHYVIYRGTDPSFIPTSTNMLTSAYDTMFFDGGWTWEDGYVYKVSAVDIHGNESGYALLLPGQVTGDDPPTPSRSDYLSQNWPNPFNPSTTIQFGLKKSSHVRLSIYDASGRLVSELVNSTLSAGNYSEIWNGTNSSGAYVASGIYFYRLDAGEFSMKRKMVLLR